MMRKTKLVTALAAVLIFAGSPAQSAGLGQMEVHSALGQPLAAEIDVLLANPDEFRNLHARLAPLDTVRLTNVEKLGSLQSLHFRLTQRADGSVVLYLTSDKPVNEPALDLIVELDWSGGKLMREYTLLVDPPGLAAQEHSQSAVSTLSANLRLDALAQRGLLSPPRQVANIKVESGSGSTANLGPDTIKVNPGMTLSGIAEQHLPEGVGLGQMLVGLYRANPQAFEGSMGRLKAGAALHLPDSLALRLITPVEVARELGPHSKNLGVRHQPATLSAAADNVRSVPPEATPEIPVAAQDEQSTQQKPLDNPITHEQVLQDAGNLPPPEQPPQGQASVLSALAATQLTPAPQPPVMPPKQHPIKRHQLKLTPPQVPPTPKWYGMLNPLYLGAGASALLLTIFALLRRRRSALALSDTPEEPALAATPKDVIKSPVAPVDSNITEFGLASVGDVVHHDIDPVTEADVYLAYGRDVQAEEILREALLKEPNRHELKLKLLEVYAGRNNLPAFESIATELHSAAGAESDIWQKAAEMGRRIDPHNPLYGGLTAEAGMSVSEEPAANLPTAMMLDDELPVEEKLSGMMDFDMNALHQSPTHEVEASVGAAPVQSTDASPGLPADADLSWDFEAITEDEQPVATTHQPDPHVAMDFELPDVMAHQETAALLQPEVNDAATASDAVAGADFANDAIDQSSHLPEIEAIEIHAPEASPDEHPPSTESTFAHQQPTDQQLTDQQPTDQQSTDQQTSVQKSADLSGHDMPVALDFSDINLDFDEPAPSDQQAETEDHAVQTQALPDSGKALSEAQQEVRTKFELALVYQEMGDLENASEILQEVIAEGDEQQKKDAMALLEQMKE